MSHIAELIIDEALKCGADEVQTKIMSRKVNQVRFSNNEISAVLTLNEKTAQIYVAKDERALVAEIANLQENEIKSTIKSLISMAKSIKPHESYSPLPEGPFKYREIPDSYDPKIAELNEKTVELVEEAINAALQEGAKRSAGTLYAMEDEIILKTSRNVESSHKATSIILYVRSFVNGEISGQGVSCGRTLKNFNAGQAGVEAAQDAIASSKVVKLSPGKYETLLDYSAAAVLISLMAQMGNAFYVDSGLSCMIGKINEKVASEKVTIIDNPHTPDGLNTMPFDDEGNPTKPTTLIENGILKTYLHNRLTAKKYKTETTANAGIIHPRAWNINLMPGEPTKEEQIQEMKEGIIVKNMGYVRFTDYAAGDFSAVLRDGILYVKNGEIKGGIKGFRLADNYINILKGIQSLSREPRQIFHWWMETETPTITPTIKVTQINYTKPT